MRKSTTLAAATLALLASSALAGVVFIPTGGIYLEPDLAPTDIRRTRAGGGIELLIRTTGLEGVFQIDAADVPPQFDPPEVGCAKLPFRHDLSLQLRCDAPADGSSLCAAEGTLKGQMQTDAGPLQVTARIAGEATCTAAAGDLCAHIILGIDVRGTLQPQVIGNGSVFGTVDLRILGSLVGGDGGGGAWAAMVSTGKFGGDVPIVNRWLSTMEEGEACGG